VYEFMRHQPRFYRPDMVVEPVHERLVVRQSAHQGHRGMGMQVDESRDQHVVGELHVPFCLVAQAASSLGSTSTISPMATTTE